MNTSYRFSLLVTLVLLCYSCCSATDDYYSSQEQLFNSLETFKQKVDHTNLSTTYWDQLIYKPYSYGYGSKYPVFLLLANSLSEVDNFIHDGQIKDYAQNFSATRMSIIHRYYSKAPVNDLSLTNLELLNTEQAVEDVAYFINSLVEDYWIEKTQKIILFGGKYSGSLAAAVKRQHPKLIRGVVATGAPMRNKFDFKEYFVSMKNILASHSKRCSVRLHQAIRQMSSLFNLDTGLNKIKRTFKLDFDLKKNDSHDQSILIYQLARRVQDIVEYNKVGAAHEKKNIPSFCNFMTGQILKTAGRSPLDQFAYFHNTYFNPTSLLNYNKFVSFLRNTSVNANNGRQWLYQACYEYGWFATSTLETDLFSKHLPVSFYVDLCHDVFDKSISYGIMKSRIALTDRFYAKVKKETEDIIFVNGMSDPWSELSVKESAVKNQTVFNITGGHNCADLYKADSYTLPSVREAHANITSVLRKWIK